MATTRTKLSKTQTDFLNALNAANDPGVGRRIRLVAAKFVKTCPAYVTERTFDVLVERGLVTQVEYMGSCTPGHAIELIAKITDKGTAALAA